MTKPTDLIPIGLAAKLCKVTFEHLWSIANGGIIPLHRTGPNNEILRVSRTDVMSHRRNLDSADKMKRHVRKRPRRSRAVKGE